MIDILSDLRNSLMDFDVVIKIQLMFYGLSNNDSKVYNQVLLLFVMITLRAYYGTSVNSKIHEEQ